MERNDTRAGGTTGDDNPWRINKSKKSPRIFADEGPGAKWSCLGSVALLIAVAGGGIAFCNHETAERARVDALQKAEEAKEEEAHYQDRVRSGQVCADGPSDLDTALELNVKRQLKDPDSFEHMGTVITPSSKGGYDALMRYRAKNSLGGYVVGTAVATLYVAERGVCEVRTFKVAG
ncbi:MAG: hypothetical protein EOO77_10505 [Oxalobacteraceae bacterium]|nr:MAG: hypothetical protein EOO77_10505 [Oxalobacteraceae bacterium]